MQIVGKAKGQDAVAEAVCKENFTEAWCDDAADAEIRQCPDRLFPA
jgi:hypothetical protein